MRRLSESFLTWVPPPFFRCIKAPVCLIVINSLIIKEASLSHLPQLNEELTLTECIPGLFQSWNKDTPINKSSILVTSGHFFRAVQTLHFPCTFFLPWSVISLNMLVKMILSGKLWGPAPFSDMNSCSFCSICNDESPGYMCHSVFIDLHLLFCFCNCHFS